MFLLLFFKYNHSFSKICNVSYVTLGVYDNFLCYTYFKLGFYVSFGKNFKFFVSFLAK